MVLPLIPLAVIAVGAATGSGGVVLGGKGASDIKKARGRARSAERRHSNELRVTNQAAVATNDRLARLGDAQEEALTAVVRRMGDFLRRHARQVRESERLLVDGIDVTRTQVPGEGVLDVHAVAWVRGVVGSVAAGGGASMGLTGAATTYGVASTGAAISGLSGAAAESATLALLGGGSLASGGGGMALGATVLNFATVGPALLVGGSVVKRQGSRALTEARRYEAEVGVATARYAESRARLRAIDRRTAELVDLLQRLRTRAVIALDNLEREQFDPDLHTERFQLALSLVMAVRDVATTAVVDGTGEVNDETEELKVRYRPMVDEEEDA